MTEVEATQWEASQLKATQLERQQRALGIYLSANEEQRENVLCRRDAYWSPLVSYAYDSYAEAVSSESVSVDRISDLGWQS